MCKSPRDPAFTGRLLLNPEPTDTTYASALTVSNDCQNYYWRVRAYNVCGWSKFSAARSFTICDSASAPVRIAPVQGATDVPQPITLRWDSLTNAAKYWVQVSTNTGYSRTAFSDSTANPRFLLPTLAEGTQVLLEGEDKTECGWGLWSASNWDFTTRTSCPKPTPPTRVLPTDGATTVVLPVLIDWDTVLTAARYHLQIDDTSDWVRPEVDDTTLTTTSLIVNSQLRDTAKYYWRMRGFSDTCGWGEWNAVAFSFTTAKSCPPPDAPTLYSPANSPIILEFPVHLQWYPTASHRYRLRVYDTVSLVSPVIDTQLYMVSNFTVTGLDSNTSYYWKVQTDDSGDCGWSEWSPVWRFRIGPVAVEDISGEHSPSQFSLSQNYPNPFNPTTAIEFSVPRTGQVTLDVYDVLGRRVRRLVSETVSAGIKRVIWDGLDADGLPAASGIYFYRIEVGEYRETRKMLLLK